MHEYSQSRISDRLDTVGGAVSLRIQEPRFGGYAGEEETLRGRGNAFPGTLEG